MRSTVSKTIIVLGFVSFLNELSSQIVAPLIPLLLVTTLGAGPVAMGLVDGVADAVASGVRLWAGRRSDVRGRRRKIFVVMGYGLSSIARPLVGLALNWPVVMLLRSLDRVGKGVRGAPRDALVADATPAALRGHAYGINRALDYAGAVGGSLIAAAALLWISHRISVVIMLSAIPAALALVVLMTLVKDVPAKTIKPGTTPAPLRWRALTVPSRRFLTVFLLFAFASASESFILLRAHEIGMGNVQVLLLWAVLCAVQAGVAWRAGKVSDRFNKVTVVASTWLAYGVGLLLFAFVENILGLWIVVVVYALLSGIGEGAEKTLVSTLATEADRGTAFGWFTMISGLGAIPAGLMFGVIWQQSTAGIAFGVFGVLAIVSGVLLWVILPTQRAATI
ncbi:MULTISPECIES: MFS transporter [Pseudomonadota]|uniref:Major Facilitator Superfamily transporter n=1 Tax=Rhodanobacter denitrificans TaxID=666685 RepID=M4NN84_9GAMM|nr:MULTISPECIES: MFS transporter [Pseudomonadota]AGG89166.1 Major Facilitator Superfamily transporter [Rhodanobacter denitrificans]TAN24939.1 MAG: MFS transporter [Castellaniella sp.]UJJ56823.1 MFS transporter [Rhodanobacter thiooxydans]UJJ60541.1 MFS transporter [Rhodanobacter denitrificans]